MDSELCLVAAGGSSSHNSGNKSCWVTMLENTRVSEKDSEGELCEYDSSASDECVGEGAVHLELEL